MGTERGGVATRAGAFLSHTTPPSPPLSLCPLPPLGQRRGSRRRSSRLAVAVAGGGSGNHANSGASPGLAPRCTPPTKDPPWVGGQQERGGGEGALTSPPHSRNDDAPRPIVG